MKQIQRRNIELLIYKVKNCAKNIKTTKNHNLNVDQSSIIKQYAVEIFEHTYTFSYIINIEIVYTIIFNEKITTLQKLNKFVDNVLNYRYVKLKTMQKTFEECRIIVKFIILNDYKTSTSYNSMYNVSISIIFKILNFAHFVA